MKKSIIQENEFEKLILVKSKEKKIYLYENDNLIKTFDEVYFGKNGFSQNKKEGDGCTPKGHFKIGFAFGTEDLNTTYPYYKLNENIYWIDDINSKYYNEWVEVTSKKKDYLYSYMHTCDEVSWKKAEHLIDYKIQYQLALVIEYNINPKVKGNGSAIFIHVKNKNYTEGCIATTKENMLYIIKWIENSNPQILIC